MKSVKYEDNVIADHIGIMRRPSSVQQNARYLANLELSGEETLYVILDQHYEHHTGKLMIHRDTVLQLIDFGIMQLFGFPSWKQFSLPEAREWLDDDVFAEIDRNASDVGFVFGKDGRRTINAYKALAYECPKHNRQLRRLPQEIIISTAIKIHRKRLKLAR